MYGRLSVPGAAATNHERWASVDAVRALAALMVLAAHAYQLGGPRIAGTGTGRVTGALADGVWLFFAISGFLIGGPFLVALVRGRPLPPAGRYAVRRVARIMPAYWIAFGAILVFVTGSAVVHWWQVPVHALLLHGLVPNENQRLYFVAWTLGLEAVFYVLVPLGAVVVVRLRRRREGRIDVDWLARILLGLWAFTVVWGIAIALAHPFGPDGTLRVVFSVPLQVVGLGNFCPGLLVFLAEMPEAKAAGPDPDVLGPHERVRVRPVSPADRHRGSARARLRAQRRLGAAGRAGPCSHRADLLRRLPVALGGAEHPAQPRLVPG